MKKRGRNNSGQFSQPEKDNGELRINPNDFRAAINGNEEAIKTMFQQFISEDENIEEILYLKYLGLKGLWGIGVYSFICLTNRRIADLTVGRFGEITYQDGYLEGVNSSFIYKPSIIFLYISSFLLFIFIFTSILPLVQILSFHPILGFMLTCIVFALSIPFAIRIYYGFVKCGIVFAVKEGIPIYIFSDYKHMKYVNDYGRMITIAREERIKLIKRMHIQSE